MKFWLDDSQDAIKIAARDINFKAVNLKGDQL